MLRSLNAITKWIVLQGRFTQFHAVFIYQTDLRNVAGGNILSTDPACMLRSPMSYTVNEAETVCAGRRGAGWKTRDPVFSSRVENYIKYPRAIRRLSSIVGSEVQGDRKLVYEWASFFARCSDKRPVVGVAFVTQANQISLRGHNAILFYCINS